GLSLRPRLAKGGELAAKIDFDPHDVDMDRIIEAWLPLTFAVNSINRSMGLPGLYPFVLAPPEIVKLAFVHGLIDRRPRHNAQAELFAQGHAQTALRELAAGSAR